MTLTWQAIDQTGSLLGEGQFESYGEAFVALHDRFGDRFSACVVKPTTRKQVKFAAFMREWTEGREFPSWDAGR